MSVALKIRDFIERSSFIRKMFEEGIRLKAELGPENVFDFSLGNPDLPPPPEFSETLRRLAADEGAAAHRYMPNAGFPETRAAIAAHLTGEQGVEVDPHSVVITTGAAGALNCILKAIINPGEEVIVPAPYFVEYDFYLDNHGGSAVPVNTRDDFSLDIQAVEAALTEKTRAVLINSPNNPTGQVYSARELHELKGVIEKIEPTVYLISDEPYRKIVYDGVEVPSIFEIFEESIIATSFSKDLSIPGERIGYAAVSPRAKHGVILSQGIALANRILGFVNAPAFMQRAITPLLGRAVDITIYKRRRDLFYEGLIDAGYEVTKPKGAFYLFPRSPIPDDKEFVDALKEERILAVPGSGFMGPGYFRVAYCVPEEVISGSLEGFGRARARFK